MERHLFRILRGFIGMVVIAVMVIGAIGIILYLGASLLSALFFWMPDFSPPWHLLVTGSSIVFVGFLCLCYHVGDSDLFNDENK